MASSLLVQFVWQLWIIHVRLQYTILLYAVQVVNFIHIHMLSCLIQNDHDICQI